MPVANYPEQKMTKEGWWQEQDGILEKLWQGDWEHKTISHFEQTFLTLRIALFLSKASRWIWNKVS